MTRSHSMAAVLLTLLAALPACSTPQSAEGYDTSVLVIRHDDKQRLHVRVLLPAVLPPGASLRPVAARAHLRVLGGSSPGRESVRAAPFGPEFVIDPVSGGWPGRTLDLEVDLAVVTVERTERIRMPPGGQVERTVDDARIGFSASSGNELNYDAYAAALLRRTTDIRNAIDLGLTPVRVSAIASDGTVLTTAYAMSAHGGGGERGQLSSVPPAGREHSAEGELPVWVEVEFLGSVADMSAWRGTASVHFDDFDMPRILLVPVVIARVGEQ